jgi:Kef-type K+ transport system membrane component KefB
MGFLAPIAFAFFGVSFIMTSDTNWWFMTVILGASFISKILGGYIGGRLAGFHTSKSLAIGYGLNARGMMELVIANIAFQRGLIDTSLYSILVIIALLTTLFTPFLMKSAYRRIDKKILHNIDNPNLNHL